MEYINEEYLSYPFFTTELLHILEDISDMYNNPISNSLLLGSAISKLSDYARWIDIKKETFEITFLPKDKQHITTDNGSTQKFSTKNRRKGKPIRIFKKVLIDKFSDQKWEEFNNILKAIITSNDFKFELVSRENISYWYNENTYFNSRGTLSNSCMRTCDPEFFDIYMNNCCQMLILTKFNKLVGRALVWTDHWDRVFMDRVYYNSDELYPMFIAYAKDQHWNIREHNHVVTDNDECLFLYYEDNYQISSKSYIPINFSIDTIPNYFPYLDSFKFLHVGSPHILSNVRNDSCDEIYLLQDTEGYYIELNVDVCANCGDTLNSEDKIYSNIQDIYLCCDCAVWSDYLKSYLNIDDSQQIFYDKDKSREDFIYAESIPFGIVYIGDDYYVYDNATMVQIDDEYYFKDDSNIIFDEETEEYKLKDEN